VCCSGWLTTASRERARSELAATGAYVNAVNSATAAIPPPAA
jgi:hypothetical protein